MAAEGGGGGGGEEFEERVKRLFGSSLFGDVPASSFPAASWSVAAGEVERQRWARPSEARDEEEERAGADRADTPCASSFYDTNGCLRGRKRRPKQDFEGDLDGDDENDDDEEEDRKGDDEEEVVRVSIGLDPTLDREEEEDNFDRVAFGREDAAERLYMSEIMGDGMNMSVNTVVPDLLDDTIQEICGFSKDRRADHSAASARCGEDDGSAEGGPHSPSETKQSPTVRMQAMNTQDISVKPILKRKEEQGDAKPRKRVRFNADVKDQPSELAEHDEDSPMVPQSMDVVTTKEKSSTPSESPGIPDYVRNPSKYTCYTLDTPESTDESNRRALANLHNLLGRSDPNNSETAVEIPSSITFIPRKKAVDAMVVDEGPKSSDANPSPVSLTAVDSDGTDQCEMDEDDPKAPSPSPIQTNSKINSRRYRSSRADDE